MKAALAAARPVDNLVDDAVFLGLLGIHDEVALHIALDAIERLACVLGHQGVGDFTDAKDFASVNVDVGGLTAEASHGRLMDQNARVGKREPLTLCSSEQQERAHAGSLTDAEGCHRVLDVLHGVIDGEAGSDGTAWRVDVELDVLVWVFARQEQQLCDHKIGYLIVNRRAKKNDVIAQQTRVNVVGTLAATRLLNNHGNQCHVCPSCSPVQLPLSSPPIYERDVAPS